MDVRNILVGVIFVVILYVIYIYAFKKNQSSLVTTQKVDKSVKVDVSGNNSSNSYSMWLYVSQWDVDQKKHIMTRFSESFHDKQKKCYSPTVYLEKNNNTLQIVYQYDLVGDQNPKLDSITISDFPIQSWTNLIISTNTKTVDVYVNGKLVRSHILYEPPNNPKGKLYLGRLNKIENTNETPYPANEKTETSKDFVNSYNGYISTVNYFDEPLTPDDAWRIYNKGYDDAGLNTNVLGKYKVKMSILDNNREINSVEI